LYPLLVRATVRRAERGKQTLELAKPSAHRDIKGSALGWFEGILHRVAARNAIRKFVNFAIVPLRTTATDHEPQRHGDTEKKSSK
jgi:hypothetical protein